MMGLTFKGMIEDEGRPKQCLTSQRHSPKNAKLPLLRSLADPLVQDMSLASRKYLFLL